MRHLIVTDQHGMRRQTDHALESMAKARGPEADLDHCRLIVLGDMIDYHRESKEVLSLVAELVERGRDPILLIGNHEEAICTAMKLSRPVSITAWLTSFHGFTTCRSYNVQSDRIHIAGDYTYLDHRRVETHDDIIWFLNEVFGPHLDVFRHMQYYHIVDKVLYSHAGLIEGKQVEEIEPWLFCWGSEHWHQSRYDGQSGRVVYGHWHQKIHPVINPWRICLALDGTVAVFCPEAGLVTTSDGMYYEVNDSWTITGWG